MTLPHPEENGRVLADRVRVAIEEAEADLSRMPFFVRPMARAGFHRHTGYAFADWRDRLASFAPTDTPASVRRRWPDAEAALARLLDNWNTAPERARKGMGNQPEILRLVVEKSAQRARLTQALLDWLRA